MVGPGASVLSSWDLIESCRLLDTVHIAMACSGLWTYVIRNRGDTSIGDFIPWWVRHLSNLATVSPYSQGLLVCVAYWCVSLTRKYCSLYPSGDGSSHSKFDRFRISVSTSYSDCLGGHYFYRTLVGCGLCFHYNMLIALLFFLSFFAHRVYCCTCSSLQNLLFHWIIRSGWKKCLCYYSYRECIFYRSRVSPLIYKCIGLYGIWSALWVCTIGMAAVTHSSS